MRLDTFCEHVQLHLEGFGLLRMKPEFRVRAVVVHLHFPFVVQVPVMAVHVSGGVPFFVSELSVRPAFPRGV